jgi:Domain of unknown function (DUF4082)/PEP-CTERM motif
VAFAALASPLHNVSLPIEQEEPLMKRFIPLLLLGIVLLPVPARAGSIGLTAFSGGSNFTNFNGTHMTLGWSFTATDDLIATMLGFWDASPTGPLGQNHQVGLWTSGGTLVASTTVLTTSPLTGGFRYEAIAPTLLLSGQSYVLGAEYYSPFADLYRQSATSATFDPAISFLGDTRNDSAGGFSFPGTLTTNTGRFGPNIQFEAAVPEPASVFLMGLGAVALIRRRARQ